MPPQSFEEMQRRLAELEAENQALRAERDEARQQQALLHRVLDSLPVMVWMSNPLHSTVFVNRVQSDFMGITDDSAPGITWAERLHPDDREQVLAEALALLDAHQPFDLQYRLRRHDGTYRWMIDRGRPMSNDGGEFMGYTGVTFDITEWRADREALRASDERLRAVVEQMPVMLNAVDEEGNFVFWNKECERVTGYTSEEVVGRPGMLSVLYPDPQYLASKLAEMQAFGSHYRDMEWIVTRKDGTQRITLWSSVSVHLPLPGWSAWGVGIDITPWVALGSAMQDSMARYTALLESTSAIIYRYNLLPSPHYEFVSATIASILGYPAHAFYDDPELIFRIVHPEDRHLVKEGLRDPDAIRRADRVRYLRPDGTLVWLEDRATPTLDEEGRVIAIEGFARDVTPLVEAEVLRSQLEEEKAETLSKLRFFSMVSHELRTPLATILSSSDMIRVYGERMPDEHRAQHVERIQSAVQYMSQMLEDFLTIGLIETGRLQMRHQTIDLERFCRAVIDEVRQAVRGTQPVQVEVLGDCRTVQSDDRLLRQIMTNLISNAVKYSPDDTVIEFTLDCTGEWARLRVRDQGIGIPPEEQDQLFRPFFRATNARGIRGTGLGLSITRAAVEILGGSIGLESIPGQGTTFTVWLPLIQV